MSAILESLPTALNHVPGELFRQRTLLRSELSALTTPQGYCTLAVGFFPPRHLEMEGRIGNWSSVGVSDGHVGLKLSASQPRVCLWPHEELHWETEGWTDHSPGWEGGQGHPPTSLDLSPGGEKEQNREAPIGA